DTASARTSLFALGFHAVASPLVASSAAMLLRGCPPTLVNTPPTYTVLPDTASTRTAAKNSVLVLGFQPSSVPSARMCARLTRATPATELKWPPMYQPPDPSGVTADTLPLTRGQPSRGAPLTPLR